MLEFSEWVKLRESSESLVTGQGVRMMQSTMRDMASRGAPTEYNDYGFNKSDWTTYRSLLDSGHIDSLSVPVRVAGLMLRILSRYRNTQVSNYEEISRLVSRDMASLGGQETKDKVFIYDRQPQEYGKTKVYIPHGVDRSTTTLINKIIDPVLEREGAERTRDRYGNVSLPRFKKFSVEKGAIHTYRIHRGVLAQIIDLLKSKGMDVEYESGSAQAVATTTAAAQSAPEENRSGTVSSLSSTERVSSSEQVIKFADEAGAKAIIKVNYRMLDQGKKQFLKEAIQYTFPEYEWNKDQFHYVVSGNYKQYVSLGRLLSKFGYDVSALREVVRKKLADGRLGKTGWEGEHDDNKDFLSQIEDRLPESKFDLYDEQKRGIAFLYGRDHAILGDETGLGKTVQLISAAALRMQDNSKPTLIITLKSTQKQWVEEVVNVMGDGERSKVSTDPLSPRKWTVLYYENFSSGKKLQESLSVLSKAGFGIVIFDELHKVKHSTSKRSQNIAKVVESIQTKWGASATVSSNKPMDVKNQLAITGHHLGRVSDSKFKRDFAGMVATGYGGSLQKSDNEEEEINSAERLNKWLNLSGVYVRRSKSEVRQMPNISVGDEVAQIDQGRFQGMYASKVSEYKNPDLPISRLIAARETIAQLKTDKTTAEAIGIVNSGIGKPPAASKVVVFSNFIESGRQLARKIDEELKRIDPKFHVLTYLSDTKKAERAAVKSRFTEDPNAKVLVMSMRMGGTGIDFPNAAQHMIINDFDWTPESAEQSEGRIYRINTDHPVKIRYVVGDGLDRDLFQRVQKKREIAAIIQRYRREYQDSEHNAEALKKIVDAQKEIKKIDKEMQASVAAHVPGAEGAMSESFSDYMGIISELWPLEVR